MANYTVLVDVFDEKEEILGSFSDEELKEELARREEENDHVETSKHSLEIFYNLDLSEYYDDILSEEIGDMELLDEVELRGHTINEKKYGNLKEIICDHIGFRTWSSKEQILKELEYYL